MTSADPGGPRRPPEAEARRDFPPATRGNRLMLADVLDLTVVAADCDLLDPGREYGASPPALRPLRQPAGPSSSPGLKAKQTAKQQHPDPGAVVAFAVLLEAGRIR